MKTLVTVDGRAGELRYERAGDVCKLHYQAAGGDAVECEASMVEVAAGGYSILVDGRVYEVQVGQDPRGGLQVDIDGRRVSVDVRDPRGFRRSGGAGSGEGRQSVAAPMPGKVIRILVAEGDQVEAGAGLVVVEAMKMQNEMKAPKSGRVTQMKAREGDTVAAGDVLAVIE